MREDLVETLDHLLRESPSNWGKWGPTDEVGSLNYLDAAQVLRGVAAVRQGRVFTLQLPFLHPDGDPLVPARSAAKHFMAFDKGHYRAGKKTPAPGGLEAADDYVSCYLQGTTHYDGLGHAWYADELWNGHSADETVGGMAVCGVYPIAERGVVGRGLLLDVARFRGVDALAPGETFDHEDLMEVADRQGVSIQKRDILLVRTGFMGSYYHQSAEEFYRGLEPGLTYSPELVDWFHEMEIPNLVTDTFSNEVGIESGAGPKLVLHAALMRNLGIAFTEMAALDDLAEDSTRDGQHDFLYAAAPLKVVPGTGAPANPIAVK